MQISGLIRYTDYNMKSDILKIFVIFSVISLAAPGYGRVIDDPSAAAMYNEMGVKAFKDASEGKDEDAEEAPKKDTKKQIAAPDDLDDEPEGQKQASSSKRAEGE